MKVKSIARIAVLLSLAFLFFAFAGGKRGVHPIPVAHAQGTSSESSHCQPVGGTVMTNLGVVDASTTLGVVDGDLKGAVAATILKVVSGQGGTTVFTVQHHFVTQAGDTIVVDQATATTKEVVPGSGLYAILSYPVHIIGGTGRFAGATGDFNNIGAAELNADGIHGRTVFRYSGQVCFAAPSNP
ncbi:MAG TPA: hypothetical protein VGK96_20540 [Candidatus Sulfotelmatobacter sp.]|jgi:hypothetical protein